MDIPGSAWRRSPGSETGGCVEVAFVDGRVVLRDSKDPDGPVLKFTFVEWEAFVGGVRLGEFEVSPLANTGIEADSSQPSQANS